MRHQQPHTIVLIHGPWLTTRSWTPWAERYTAQGFRVLTPAWPGLEHPVQALREDPSPVAAITVDRLVDHYESLVLDQDEPPIVMGHSCGGTMAQILLDRGLGAAGVGLASPLLAAAWQLRVPVGQGSTTRDALAGRGVVPLGPEEFHRAFTNTLDRSESDAIYRRHYVPAPGATLGRDAFAAYRRPTRADRELHRDPRAPLLLIAFGEDSLVPPATVREDDSGAAAGTSITERVEFPGRPHFPSAPGWEDVADYAATWSVERARGVLREVPRN